MSRWAKTFAALSARPDRLDTVRHSDGLPSTVSHTVDSVTAAGTPFEPPIPRPTDRVLATWSEVEEERAAIVEYDGGIPRAWAEGFARLDPNQPPADVPPNRWRRFVDDVGSFLDGPFCAVAAALGWTAFDLFGADRDRPFARVDQLGLLWLLEGDRLDLLTSDAATFVRRSGARQTFGRTPHRPGQVLAWEVGLEEGNLKCRS
jgi:hypothetical protein